MKPDYTKTLKACFTGYIVQAIVNNFTPLLFLTFQSEYGIPLEKITLLVTLNFGLQLVIDLLSAGLVDKIGYRASALAAHGLAAAGLILLAFLPELLPDPFMGLLLSVMVYAVGGGLLEVIVSPMVEACPTKNKEKTMSMLHSFYCWGQVGVVLLSTLFFALFGIARWRILAWIWALLPLANGAVFLRVPIATLESEDGPSLAIRDLARKRMFWILMLLMLCAGACEQSISQWASTFAEKGLGVNKTVGDLAGPMMFAAMTGLSRTLYGKHGDRIGLRRFMACSGVLCAVSYLLVSLSPLPFFSLFGCGLCGLAIGILWPGTYSMAAAAIRGGGTAMFAFLALAGDLGCSGGPTLVGLVAGACGGNLKAGILAAFVFPVLLLFGIFQERSARRSAA